MREVLHLDFNPGSVAWLGSLQSRVANSPSPELRKRYEAWSSAGLGELALAIATRLGIAKRVEERLRESITTLAREVEESGQLDSLIADSSCFRPSDEKVLFDICSGVDACFFEWRSLYEVLGKFAKTFAIEILHTEITEAQLKGAVSGSGVPIEWMELLRDNRKLFFHQTAPWIALEITSRKPLVLAILVMKENLSSFEDAEKFVTEAELVQASNGLRRAVDVVRDWLAEQVVTLERELAASAD